MRDVFSFLFLFSKPDRGRGGMQMGKTFWVVLAAMMTVAAAASATQDRGMDRMTLAGGSRGDVPFPHHRHQDAIESCEVCHETFPRQAGAIEALKRAGDIEPKHVMNRLCTKCHREKRRAGEKSGPTTCGDCHERG
jgi:hypothetical protein